MSLGILSVFSLAAHAQLPSQRVSPINYFGRYHGIGYSDGYHACKEGRCNNGSWKPWESFSSFYGAPTPPPSSRLSRQPMANSSSSVVVIGNEYHSQPIQSPINLPVAPRQSLSQPQNPGYEPIPMRSSQPAVSQPPFPSTTAPNLHEQVPPAPLKLPALPSDQDLLDLPAPDARADQGFPAPSVQSRRVPPGAHPWIQQSSFRSR